MAFTNTPTSDTYSTVPIPLVAKMLSRAGTTTADEDYLNVFIDVEKSMGEGDPTIYAVKRAGCVQQIATVGTGEVRGSFFLADNKKFYYCVGANVYVYNVLTGASTTLSAVFVSTTGPVGFCEFLYGSEEVKVVATDGTRLVTIDNSNVVVTSVSPNLPVPHTPLPVFLDKYLFLAKLNTAEIYNSNLDDPLSFTVGDVISTEMEGDWIRALAKSANYLVAFGSTSIEYFWDAFIDSGSPMQRNDTPIKSIKYLSGLCNRETDLFFIGAGKNESPAVYKMRDFKAEKVSSTEVERYLAVAGDAFGSWTLNTVSFFGKSFLVLNAGTTKTWFLDLETSMWSRIAFGSGATFPLKLATQIEDTFGVYTWFALEGNTAEIYVFSEGYFQDNGANYTAKLTTKRLDFGSLYNKAMHKLLVFADRTSGSLDVSWSDDDYATFSTPVSVALNQELPTVKQLGTFRRRALRYAYTHNSAFRMSGVQVEINKGNR